MQLLQAKQLVEILDFVTYAQLVITILDVSQHQVHQLPENLLIALSLLSRVAHESHHDIEAEFVLYFHLK